MMPLTDKESDDELPEPKKQVRLNSNKPEINFQSLDHEKNS